MPLPPTDAPRTRLHRRRVSFDGFKRADGLWDIEGHLTDIWPTPVPKAGGLLPPGEPMHAMWLRLTIDATATIVDAEASTDAGPYGHACGAINADYRKLIGVQVARGYRDAIRKLFGRTAGCTPINERAGAMGSAAMQAMWEDMNADPAARPAALDGCHALKSDGPQVAAFFPRWYAPAPRTAG